MLGIVIAIFLTLHGAAHLVGFASSWGASPDPSPLKTTVLSDRVNLGAIGIRLVGTLWLFAALAYGLAAAGAVLGAPWWVSMAIVTTVASLVLSVIWWPESRLGVPVNLALPLVLSLGTQRGWF